MSCSSFLRKSLSIFSECFYIDCLYHLRALFGDFNWFAITMATMCPRFSRMILISRTDLIVSLSTQIIVRAWAPIFSSENMIILSVFSFSTGPRIWVLFLCSWNATQKCWGKAMVNNRVIRVSGWGRRTRLSPSWYLIMPDHVLSLFTLLLTHFFLHSQVAFHRRSSDVWRKVVEEGSPGFCFCNFLFRVGIEKSESVVQTFFLTWDFGNFCLSDLEVWVYSPLPQQGIGGNLGWLEFWQQKHLFVCLFSLFAAFIPKIWAGGKERGCSGGRSGKVMLLDGQAKSYEQSKYSSVLCSASV